MMMTIGTTRFGKLDIDENEVFSFPEGLPGFSDEKNFVLLKQGLEETPFMWLQSAMTGSLCFLVMDPAAVNSSYVVALNEDPLHILGPGADSSFAMTIVTVRDGDFTKATTNLKAPVVFNPSSKLGLQIILDQQEYSLQHPVFQSKGA